MAAGPSSLRYCLVVWSLLRLAHRVAFASAAAETEEHRSEEQSSYSVEGHPRGERAGECETQRDRDLCSVVVVLISAGESVACRVVVGFEDVIVAGVGD